MKIRNLLGGFVCLLVIVFLLLGGVLWAHIHSEEFRVLAEERIGDFLNADLNVEKVKVNSLNEVALKGLDLYEESDESSLRVKVEEILFQYDFVSLVQRKLEGPSQITLESPELWLSDSLFPYDLLKNLDFDQKSSRPVGKLKLMNGYISYPMAGTNEKLELDEVDAEINPRGNGEYGVKIRAILRGYFNGDIEISGFVDVHKRMHRLRMKLLGVELGESFSIPVRKIRGDILWNNDNLMFEQLEGEMHGLNIHVGGQLLGYVRNPLLDLQWRIGKNSSGVLGSLNINMQEGVIRGTFGREKGLPHNFQGNIKRQLTQYLLNDISFDNGVEADGIVDFTTGKVETAFSKDSQEFQLDANLRTLDSKVELKVNHVKVMNHDLVAKMRFSLLPRQKNVEKWANKFQVNFDTDYFILDQLPFEDLQGGFELSAYGVKRLVASWGDVFHLRGGISFFKEEPRISWDIKVGGLQIGGIEKFLDRPMPKGIDGLLNGKLKLEGPLNNPELIGNFNIKYGHLGRLQYDYAQIHLQGFFPKIKLHDSQIVRGRSEFSLEGFLDFEMENVFHGVEVKNLEKYAVWKGLELHPSHVERDLEIDYGILPLIKVQASGAEDAGFDGNDLNKEDENYLAIGPKFQF